MFYVQRDQHNALVRVEAQAFAEATETLPADHHEIQAWFAGDAVDTSLKQLKQSDLEMIRVLDDLIQVLTRKGVSYQETDVSRDPQLRAAMTKRAAGRRTVPQIYIGDTHVGGCDDLHALDRAGKLKPLLDGNS